MRAHPAGPRHGDLVNEHAVAKAPTDLNFLDDKVWASGVKRGSHGALEVNGHDVRQLADEYATPLFVLDESDFRSRARGYATSFVDADVFYASKAFNCTTLARWVAEEGLCIDVATGGELSIALRAGFPPDRILFHGNNKSVSELNRAISSEVGRIVVDSDIEIDRLVSLAAAHGVQQRVLVRVTVGVEAHTHEFIATAHEDQKFGFSLVSGAAAAAVERVLAEPSLELVGLHSHIGSQIFDTSGFEVAAHRTVELLGAIRDRHGIELPELNLGGGLGIAYVSGDDPTEVGDVAQSLREIVARECQALQLAMPRLAVEPGRAIVGPSMLTLYEVGTVKPIELDGGLVRHYVSVDGGMSDNLRTALYGAEFTAVLASRSSDAPPVLARIVGKHCESGDVIVTDAWLPSDVAAGDLVAVAATGAYCRSMASTYNAIGRPPVVSVSTDRDKPLMLLRRETEDDLLALDPGA
ncbi:MAG TPA: diaminopimelate decarboxylase [Actinomycetes bacterium]|nr:diaminopimelate decarboxylase [Actinomycetes bacterium]